jgi:hypothetical protein
MSKLVFDAIDNALELYLGSFIQPFLRCHEVFYTGLNQLLRKQLDKKAKKIPVWITANFITYFRTALVVPTLLLLAWECRTMAALLVVIVDFGDFLDGVVARFWTDMRRQGRDTDDDKKKKKERPSSPSNSDSDSFGASVPANFWLLPCRLPFAFNAIALTVVLMLVNPLFSILQRSSQLGRRIPCSPGYSLIETVPMEALSTPFVTRPTWFLSGSY